MSRTATHHQVHNAGRHLAVAEALLRGFRAALVGPSSNIEVNGHRAQVQVAGMGAWQIQDVDRYTTASIEHVVLVNVTDGRREIYVVPGDWLRRDVRERHNAHLEAHGGSRPRSPGSKHAAIYPEHVREWRDGWDRLESRRQVGDDADDR